MLDHCIGQHFDDLAAVDPAPHMDRQALPRVLVDQVQKAHRPSIMGVGTHEVVGPYVIASFRPQPDAGAVVEPQATARLLLLRYLQTFAAPDPGSPETGLCLWGGTRKVNREGQRWTEDRPGMTLRLPLDLCEAITEESRVKGDLARIVLFALSHVNKDEVDIQQTRKAGMDLTYPQLIHVGAETRTKLKEWAEAEGMSVNAIVVSVLDEFFVRLKKCRALREELKLELRAHRGFLPS